MAEAKVEKLPFFISDEEKKGLQAAPQDNMADDLKSAIPDFFEVEKGDVVAAFGLKDGLLIFHIFKKDRKAIYDQAHEALAGERDDSKASKISHNANAMLAANPWWPGFEDILNDVFADHFKYTDFKVTYYQEVDSWSVIMPELKGVAVPKTHYDAVVSKLALRVGG
jgi:hypothetical protein